MNSNRRVFRFVAYSVGLLLILSLADLFFGFGWMPLQRVNLLSDIVSEKQIPVEPSAPTDTVSAPTMLIDSIAAEDFTLYERPRQITNFKTDTSRPSLERFVQKLHALRTGEKIKVRIAYFGDSMIEGDLLTQTLRKLLQEQFGGQGVGFVPITSTVSQFRQTVGALYSSGWEDEHFKSGQSRFLYLSGHLFRSDQDGEWVKLVDRTITDSLAIIEKSLLCGQSAKPQRILVEGKPFTLEAGNTVNRIPLKVDQTRSLRIDIASPQLPVYGCSFESEYGVFVDNFSFRCITGIEFARIDSAFLASIAENNPYDLIVFQYGVNLLFRPNDMNFNWYARALEPVIRKMRNCFPVSDFLLVSTADRAFRYGQEYKSAVGIDSLVKLQAALAYSSGASFYNQFARMGGTNAVVDWAKQKPSLGNQDYVHPNHRGAEVLAKYFYEAIMTDYNKYVSNLK